MKLKRLIAILICLSMAFALFGCNNGEEPLVGTSTSTVDSENDTENQGGSTGSSSGSGNTDTPPSSSPSSSVPTGGSSSEENTTQSSDTNPSSSTSSSTQGGNTDTPSTPTITPDRTNYKATTIGSGDNKAIYYVNETLYFPKLTNYYNGYKTALSMTFDDGYDTNTGTVVSDQFEKYGFRGTMMLGPCFINGESYITEWNNVFSRGFLDLGCHGYNHQEPTTLPESEYEHEIKDAIMFLREKFPTQRVLTFATPYAHINDSYEEYLSQFVIGNRLEAGGERVVLGEDFNEYRVMAVSVNSGKGLSPVTTEITNAVKSGTWIVELYHCVLENAQNSTDINRDVFEYHCQYLYQKYRNDIWFASFEDVLIYAKQLEHTSIAYTDCDRETMTFTVTPDGTLDKEIYNIPMSMQVFVPNNLCDSAYAMIDGVYQPLEILLDDESGCQYVIVRDIPVTEEKEVIIYLGGNSTMKNNCGRHSYSVDEVIEPTHDTFGYTVNRCSKCDTTYKSDFTAVVHDYTGEEVVVIEATATSRGVTKYKCAHCDKWETRETEYTQ